MSRRGEEIYLMYVTTPSREEALSLARQLVQERLAACANVLPGLTSVYQWQGELHEDAECLLLLKTTEALAGSLKERLVALHSYECPCVVAWPLAAGHEEFLRWVSEQTGPR